MELHLDLNKRYTYADYMTWLDDKARELLNGFIRVMSPAPKSIHQKIVANLVVDFGYTIKKNKGRCQIFPAPFDVRLPKNGETEDNRIYTVVQPDVCIVCDPGKIDERGCLGAPDMIVEILSFSSMDYDLKKKFKIYEEAGVKEYWVVFPNEGVQVFILQPSGKYDEGTKYEYGKIPVRTLGNQEIELSEIFASVK
jgi:Uma2 family endonuclease